jgi:hypothetical protein
MTSSAATPGRSTARFEEADLQGKNYRELQKLSKEHGLPAQAPTAALKAALLAHIRPPQGGTTAGVGANAQASPEDALPDSDHGAQRRLSLSTLTGPQRKRVCCHKYVRI